MKNALPAIPLAAMLALGTAGCSSDPASQSPAADEALNGQPAPEATPVEPAETGASATPSSAAGTGTMESGSNDDADARKPDPARTKLIKADPQ